MLWGLPPAREPRVLGAVLWRMRRHLGVMCAIVAAWLCACPPAAPALAWLDIAQQGRLTNTSYPLCCLPHRSCCVQSALPSRRPTMVEGLFSGLHSAATDLPGIAGGVEAK